MKIIIDGRMILPQVTGVGRYLVGLCRGLLEIQGQDEFSYELWIQSDLPADHDVWSLSSPRLLLKKVPLRELNLLSHVRYPAHVYRSNPALLHYPHFDLPLATPGRIVSTIHDLKYISHAEFFTNLGRIKQFLIRLITASTCARSKFVICISKFTASDISTLLGVSTAKLRVIPLGVDELYFRKRTSDEISSWRSQKGLDFPFLLFVGERRPHKNIPGMINAFQVFRKLTDIPLRLVIAGKKYADYCYPEQMVEKIGLQKEVLFLDYVSDADLPLLYQSAEALILLSHYEGFGLPVLEAMASGTPVIGSNISSLPEVIGSAGILVPPDQPEQIAEAVSKIILNRDLRDHHIRLGLERAKQFSWRRCAQLTHSVYLEALSKV